MERLSRCWNGVEEHITKVLDLGLVYITFTTARQLVVHLYIGWITIHYICCGFKKDVEEPFIYPAHPPSLFFFFYNNHCFNSCKHYASLSQQAGRQKRHTGKPCDFVASETSSKTTNKPKHMLPFFLFFVFSRKMDRYVCINIYITSCRHCKTFPSRPGKTPNLSLRLSDVDANSRTNERNPLVTGRCFTVFDSTKKIKKNKQIKATTGVRVKRTRSESLWRGNKS